MTNEEVISWILYAISLATGQGPVSQSEISHVADGINHAVPTGAEFKLAFGWLISNGWVACAERKYFVTSKGSEAMERARRGRTTTMSVWKALVVEVRNASAA
ncbi:MAG: hypothetical protein AABY95_11335 [Pseudomonadota bacterium]